MKRILIILVLISFTCCKSGMSNNDRIYLSKKNEWITLYKKRVITVCLRESGLNLEKDNSRAIQFEIIGFNTDLIKETDSLGKIYAKRILNTPSYFQGKPIINMALTIYVSEELDKIAIKSCKKNFDITAL